MLIVLIYCTTIVTVPVLNITSNELLIIVPTYVHDNFKQAFKDNCLSTHVRMQTHRCTRVNKFTTLICSMGKNIWSKKIEKQFWALRLFLEGRRADRGHRAINFVPVPQYCYFLHWYFVRVLSTFASTAEELR